MHFPRGAQHNLLNGSPGPLPSASKGSRGQGVFFVVAWSLSSVGALTPALSQRERGGWIGGPGSGRPERGQWCAASGKSGRREHGVRVIPRCTRAASPRPEPRRATPPAPTGPHPAAQAEGLGKGRKRQSPQGLKGRDSWNGAPGGDGDGVCPLSVVSWTRRRRVAQWC